MGYLYKRKAALLLLLLLLQATDGFGAETELTLDEKVCSTKLELGNHELLSVSTTKYASIGNNCTVEFYTKDPHSTVVLSFDLSTDESSYNYDVKVSVAFYALDEHGSAKLVDLYNYYNWSDMWDQNVIQPNTARLLVVINGDWNDNWMLYFQLKAETGPLIDYPISLAAGVFALSLSCTVILTLLITCCWCCCCKKRETSEQISVRRRRRMVDQLAKDGYSVTRDYGSISSTTPFIRTHGAVVDIFSHPDAQLQPPSGPRGASNYDPPPAYESVGTQRAPAPQQNAPVGFITVVPPPEARVVPEALLVDIEAETTPATLPTAPSTDDIPQDLMEFETPPELPASPIAAMNNNHVGASNNMAANNIPPLNAAQPAISIDSS